MALAPVLVSACLLGAPVRHDAADKRAHHPLLARLRAQGRVRAVCPEMAGGLPVPRPAAEIHGAGGGGAVLAGLARVRDHQGRDVTAAFVTGAGRVLALAQHQGARLAILKQNSPSCGTRRIADGRFVGHRLPGEGVAAALLRRHGLLVFGEDELDSAAAALAALDAVQAGPTR